MKDFFKKLVDELNPGNVSWSNAGQAVEYLVKVGIVIAIVALIFAAVYYSPKFVKFLRATALELKQVSWLNRRDTYKYTIISIVILFFGTVFIVLADQAFLSIRNLLILRGN